MWKSTVRESGTIVPAPIYPNILHSVTPYQEQQAYSQYYPEQQVSMEQYQGQTVFHQAHPSGQHLGSPGSQHQEQRRQQQFVYGPPLVTTSRFSRYSHQM